MKKDLLQDELKSKGVKVISITTGKPAPVDVISLLARG
jgi:hypothetical protein